MSGITTCLTTTPSSKSAPSRQGKWFFIFLLGLLFSFPSVVVGQANTTPTYTWLKQQQLPTVNVSLSGANTEDITIAVATDPAGNVYTLSFGKGIAKRNSEGIVTNANFIPASKLDGPLDIAIDADGFIYVANYLPEGNTFADNGQIRVFNPQGVLVRTILTSFYRPMGLVVDEEKVYVAEFYDGVKGPEPGNVYSRIRIYNKTTGDILDTNNQVEVPLRIAIDSQKRVYVSQAGYTNNPKLQFFDADLNFISSIAGVTTPGSIVIDKFDYIHVIDYAGRIDFSRFMNFENLGTSEVLDIAKTIYEGQQANVFSIKIFSPSRTLLATLKNQIDFPLDLTFNDCDRMYVNNSKVFGTSLFGLFIPSRIEFHLEIYQRTPSFDQEKPILICPASIEETAPAGQNSVAVNFANPTVTDNCSFTVSQTKGQLSGNQFSVGTHTIEFTATDTAGNKDTCSFTITVNPGEEEPDTIDPVINCPQSITRNVDSGSCGAVVTYATPTATDNSGNPTVTRKEGIASGGTFPVGITTVTYEAVDAAGNKDECSFTVTVKDNENPTISCPADITVTAPTGANSVAVNYNAPSVNDRCSTTAITQTGPASGSQFAIGEHIINFTVTDAAGNFATCSLRITVDPAEEEPDTEDPVINCPQNITRNVDSGSCGAVVTYATPTATDNSGNPTVTLKEGVASGGTFPVGVTTVTYEAVDAAGNKNECSFTITIKDNEKPTISCPGDITVSAPPGQYTAMVNFIPPAVTDNCGPPTLVRNQGFSPGGQFPLGSTAVTYTATDTAGNSVTCSFIVTVEPGETEGGPAIFNNCPATITHSVSTYNCGANVAFQIPTASDDSGDLEVVRVSGPGPGDFFEVGTTIVTFEATGSDGNTVQCDFTVIVIDNENPVFYSCPSDVTLTAPVGQTSAAVNYSAPTARDNCGEPTITTSGPASGSQFPVGTTTVTFTATDASGGTATCSFKVTVEPNDIPLEVTCPQPQNRSKNENCEAVVPNFTGEVTANKEATFSQSPPAGSIISEDTTITITATAGTETKQCSFLLSITDNSPPSFSCPEDQTKTYDPATGFALPDYREQINATDNCGIKSIVQDPAPGTVIYDDQLVMLYVWDTSDMLSNCSFTVNLSEDEVLDITCPTDQQAELGDNCSFVVPDYRANAGLNFQGAQITQDPPPGSVLSQSSNIILTATLNGQTDSCSFQLVLTDTQNPSFTCIPEQNITIDPEVGFTVPDYREEANPSDNCDFIWVQLPAPGTVIFASQTVELSATDAAENRAWCSFIVRLTEEEPDGLEIDCPANKSAPLDSNCEFIVPDYRNEATINIPGAVMTQDPPAGTTINSSTSIRLTATSGSQTVDCNFLLTLGDVTAPTVVCPQDQWENYDPATNFPLPDYRNLAVTSDACGIAQIQQSPSPGTNITQNTTVSLSVTDLSGNSINCAFTVNLTQDEVVEITCPGNQEVQPTENCSFPLADYTNMAGVNFEGAQVTQAPAPGTQITGNTTVILTATFNGKTDSCAFDVYSVDNIAPVAKCILTGGYRLNQNGTLTLNAAQIDNGSSDNCGIVNMEISRSTFTTADIGDHNITLTVTDAAGNSDSCQTSISIWPYIDTGNNFACKTSIVLELDETGNAILTPQDLYTGDPQGRIFNISKTNFSCSNLGDNYINFTYQGSIDSGTCEIKVEVKDNLSPTVQTQNITVFLNEAGRAEISPAAINNGTTDNCGPIIYSLDISSFSCKDIGENMVRLTAVDASGNSSSATAMVTVTGTCDEEPPPPGGNGPDDIFIYPNPTTGPFTIATPSGQKITRVEIFDFRGRFLLSKDFAEDVTTYTLDITGVEQAVYVLNIQTSDGRKIRRVIKY